MTAVIMQRANRNITIALKNQRERTRTQKLLFYKDYSLGSVKNVTTSPVKLKALFIYI